MPRVLAGLKRPTVESCFAIDVRRWQRDGLLRQGRTFCWEWRSERGEPLASIGVAVAANAALLTFEWCERGTREWARTHQCVPIGRTSLHTLPHRSPAERPWFLCPQRVGDGLSCNRRVGLLYSSGTPYFACRKCCRLVYASTQESARARSIRRARKIRLRLGGSGSLVDPFPGKPAGMHRLTYARAVHKAIAAQERVNALGLDWLRKRGLCVMIEGENFPTSGSF
jgi:hypothetical protein